MFAQIRKNGTINFIIGVLLIILFSPSRPLSANDSLSGLDAPVLELNKKPENTGSFEPVPIEKLQAMYKTLQSDFNRLDQQNRMQRERIIYLSVIGSLVLLLVLGWGLYMRNKKQKELALREAREELERVRFRIMLEAQEKERKRIARELHDSLGQQLSTLKLYLSNLEHRIGNLADSKEICVQSMNLLDRAVKEVRTISHAMMPAVLIRKGLPGALKQLAEEINRGGKLQVEVQISGIASALGEAREISLYRIIQEVLNNLVRHSNATKTSISLTCSREGAVLEIADNGKGIELKDIERSRGIGWDNILTRVSLLNGTLQLIPKGSRGTKIHINIAA